MRHTTVICVFLFLLSGCAAYKELTPSPQLLPQERGYVELKNDKENFKLEKDTKYFIKFPRPEKDSYYLVLATNNKAALVSNLAFSFDDGAPLNARIKDEAPQIDTLLVYPVDTRVPIFYWVIDSVRYDIELWMHYRYVPRWRFAFENKYAALRDLLAHSLIDPGVYNAIGPEYDFQGLNYRQEMDKVEPKMKNLKSIKDRKSVV
jgi:hypothetical protein